MNNSVNYSGFIDMAFDTGDDYEPYGFSDISDSLESIYKSTQISRSAFHDREYFYDE